MQQVSVESVHLSDLVFLIIEQSVLNQDRKERWHILGFEVVQNHRSWLA